MLLRTSFRSLRSIGCNQRIISHRAISTTPSRLNQQPTPTTTMPEVTNLIHGSEPLSSLSNHSTYSVRHPTTSVLVHTVQASTSSDIQAAIASSAAAHKKWAATPITVRRDIFLRAASLLEDEKSGWKDKLMKANEDETEVTKAWCGLQLSWMPGAIRELAGSAAIALKSEHITTDAGDHVIVQREPFGVCFSMAAWNAVFALTNRAIVTPLLAGNTVILKTSEMTPYTQKLWVELMYAAGLPEGVINVVHIKPEDAPKLVEEIVADPRVRHINFTGSTRVGSSIASIAGKHLKPTIMELGGKAPSIVLDDADMDIAANNIIFGAFLNQGQICMSTERVIVSSKAHGKLLESMEKVSTKLKGKSFGLFSATSAERARSLIRETVEAGAKSIINEEGQKEKSNHVGPSIFTHITRQSKLWTEESFAPTVVIMAVETEGKTDAQVEEEMVGLANDTPYGLSASVFSKDYSKALRVASGIEAGAVHINSITPADPAQVPHGGWKSSGWGRFNSIDGIRNFSQSRSIEFCHNPHLYPVEIL